MKFIAGLLVRVSRGTGKTPQVFLRLRASANRRVDLHLPLIASIRATDGVTADGTGIGWSEGVEVALKEGAAGSPWRARG